MLRYAILGSIELRDGDTPRSVGGVKQVALLALLLVHANHGISNDLMIDALWGAERSAGAVKRLQMAVARLRRTLDPLAGGESALRTTSNGYLLAVAHGELDSDAFEARMAEGLRALAADEPERARDDLAAALELWRGPVALADVAYETFAQGEIRRLEEQRLAALEARVEADLRLGGHAALIGELEALIAAHPTRERLSEQLMLAYYRSGRQADALARYDRTRLRLAADLALEPGTAMAALQAKILAQAPELDVPARPAIVKAPHARIRLPPALRAKPSSPYVGRVGERDKLRAVIAAARASERRMVLIEGVPGVGKTRLAAHTALEADAAGFAAGWGSSAEALRTPYGTWIAALSHLVGCAPSAVLAGHVAQHGGEIRRLVRSVDLRVPGVPPVQTSDAETERYMLFAAVVGLLEALCAARPVAIVLDDLQWADEQSLALLDHVTAATSHLPLLLVATFRDSDLHARHPLRSLLAGLHRIPGVERIALTGLDPDEVAELMASRAGHEINGEVRRLSAEIAAETGGNPFFVGEMLRHLSEAGAIARDGSGRWHLRGTIAELGLPRSVREVVEHRVARLGEPAATILRLAAVVGQGFELGLLERLVDVGEDDLLTALEAAVAASIVVESSEPGRFAFAHALINHTLYSSLSGTRAARLHRHVAEALETLGAPDPGELSRHWRIAGATETAADYARLAGERALEQIAPHVAKSWFAEALEMSPQEDGRRCDALIGLGEAQRQLGDAAFRDTLLEAGAIGERLGDVGRLTRAVLANTLGPFGAAGPRDDQRIRLVESALDVAPADSPARPRMMAILAKELYFGAEPERGAQLGAEALALARRGSDQRELARVLAFTTAVSPIAPLEAHGALVRELGAMAEQLDDPELRFRAANTGFIYAMHSGDPIVLDESVATMVRQSEAIGDPVLTWTALWAGSARRWLAGDLVAAEELTNEAARLAIAQKRGQGLVITFGQLLAVRTEQDRLGELRESLHAQLAMSPDLPVLQLARGFIDAETGRLEPAGRLLDAVAAKGFSFPFDRTRAFSLARCADIALRVGADRHAADLYDRLLPHRTQFATPAGISSRGSVELSLGRLAVALGRHDAAREHLAAARRAHDRLDAPLLRARTALAHGEALLAAGCAAGEPLELAVHLARAHGSAAIVREARARMSIPVAAS